MGVENVFLTRIGSLDCPAVASHCVNYIILTATSNSKKPKLANIQNILQRIKQLFGLFVSYFLFVQRNVMEAVAETNNEGNVQQTRESFERHGILPATTFVLEGLSVVLGFMYDNNMEHIWDYYVVVCRNSVVASSSRNVSDINSLLVCTPFHFRLQVLCIYLRVL